MPKETDKPKVASWHHVQVFFTDVQDLRIGMPLCRFMLRNNVDAAYFARYTGAPGYRIELKMCTSIPPAGIRWLIRDYFSYATPKDSKDIKAPKKVKFITVPGWVGSYPHALATQLVAGLELEGKTATTEHIMDVLHWTMNMAGFSYVQESEACLRHAHAMLSCAVPGWQSGGSPVFKNPSLLTAKDDTITFTANDGKKVRLRKNSTIEDLAAAGIKVSVAPKSDPLKSGWYASS